MPGTQKFLDNLTGLPTLWAAIGNKFVAKEEGKVLSSNDFTDALKGKLDGIAEGAEVNQNAFSTIVADSTSISADAKTDTVTFKPGANVQITSSGKEITIAATDTTYSNATTSTAGLMSGADKTKLDGIEEGAQVNQNAFAQITVGDTNVVADAASDAVTLIASSNVQIAADAEQGTVTFSATDTTYQEATTSQAGLMSAADKAALDNLTAHHGDENVIEIVKVNGVALEVGEDKSVDVTVPTAVSQLTNDSQFQTLSQVQQAISQAVTSAYIYKGSVDTEAELPKSEQKVGDVYNIVAASSYGPAGMNVAWNGTAWDALGASVTIEAMTAQEVNEICV